MIPRILELKNFLSYGDQLQQVDFKDYNLICLSGKNGNGKSALLDAMTWALWGQARKVSGASKADEGLLRLGQSRMMVSLEFSLGEHIYRVRREFAKLQNKPYAALDFEIFDEVGQRFVSLTDKTIRVTQAKIETVIGLDFETFINTAFLRQGQSNEFSKKSAKERKQILCTILGLAKYDQLQQQALGHVKKFQDEKKSLLMLAEQHTKHVAQEPLIQESLAEIQTLLKAIEEKISTQQALIKEKQTATTKQQAYLQTLKQAAIDLLNLEKTYLADLNHLHQTIAQWKQVHRQALTLPDINVLHETKKQLFEQKQQLLSCQERSIALQEKILQTKELLQKHTTTLKQAHTEQTQQDLLAKNALELALKQSNAQKTNISLLINDKLAQCTNYQTDLARMGSEIKTKQKFDDYFKRFKEHFDKRRTYYQTLVQRGNWAKNELVELEHKQKIIHDASNPACPMCEQLLTAKRKQFLAIQFIQAEAFLRNRLERISTLLKKLKELLLADHQELSRLADKEQSFTQLAVQTKNTEQLLLTQQQDIVKLEKEFAALTAEQQGLTAKLTSLQTTMDAREKAFSDLLAHDETLRTLTATCSSLETEKNSLGWNAEHYAALTTQLETLDKQIAAALTLKEALAGQIQRQATITALCSKLKDLKKMRATLIEQEAQQVTVQQALAVEMTLLANHEQALTQILKEKDLILQRIGSCEQALQSIDSARKALEGLSQQTQVLDKNSEDYQTLATAFSKNGIQALLIEDAIPEIENEANLLLAQLTDNQAQIFIESLRDLKSGGVKETLDIQIADAAGIRPYEMYSGGEAFRVDFALRIAIAKLLARRAGTALQTLIIDEGFGSQDEEGLSHIMDALYAIQNDFSKIIIVSHLTEFKHNFPVHFIIEKGPAGSLVKIEERG